MNLKITLEIDSNAEKKGKCIIDLSQQLSSCFSDKDYGVDVKEIVIGAIIVKTKSGYEDWFKMRKPKYIDYKKTKNRLTGEEMEIIKSFSFDFKIDEQLYDEFVLATEKEEKKILASTLIKSLSNLDYLDKKVNNFNKEQFKNDVVVFLEKYVD